MRRHFRDRAIKLKYLNPARGAGGKVYWYFRRAGQPGIPMPDLPHDHPDFLRAYGKALDSSGAARAAKHATGTVGALIDLAGKSTAIRAVSRSYRDMLSRQFTAIAAEAGRAPLAGLRQHHIRANLSKAPNPRARLKAWRFAFAQGVAAGAIDADPSAGIPMPRPETKAGPHAPWTAEDIATFRARYPIGTVTRAAFETLY